MYLELDGQGPRYAQLIRAMKEAIMCGRLVAGSRLPPTRELANELRVSRTTVLTAYEQLRAEGFIDAKVGSGSYVAALQVVDPPAATTTTRVSPSRYARRLEKVPAYWTRPREMSRYSLQYGEPLTNPALTTAWARELAHAARYTDPYYPQTQGLLALREAVCDYLARRRGVNARADDVLIVGGTQQALALITRVVLDEGDTAVIEDPTYFGAHRALESHGACIEAVRTDGDGLVCSELPASGARLIFVTPSHQFPSGSVLSLSRRLELLAYARGHDGWIIEDDYDGEFRYDVHPLAALRALDTHDQVIYVGTFSKSLFPALRLGYMVVPAALRETFIAAKWMSDFGSPGIEQAALANFIVNGGFDRHLQRAAKTLKARRTLLLDCLMACAGERIEITDSHAGMHLIAWLRDLDHVQCSALVVRAQDLGLDISSIVPHYVNPPPRSGLLLGYAGISVAEIPDAVRLFGICLDEFS